MDLKKMDFPANSAVFHVVKGLIFNRMIAFQVRSLRKDANDRSIKVQNEERLKERIYEKIMNRYNKRLRARTKPSEYLFTDDFKKKMAITKEKKDIFKLQYFHISAGMDWDFDVSEYGGSYDVYPLTFVCNRKKCGDIQYISKKTIRMFDPNICRRKGCTGKYEQLSILMFCEICGDIRSFYYKKEDRPVRLFRPSKDSIGTWKVQAEGEELLDFFRLTCNHKDPHDFGSYLSKAKISDAPDKKYTPLTVTEGSVYIPTVETNIDIPTTPGIEDMKDLEFILLAISLEKFKFFEEGGVEVSLEMIQAYYRYYLDAKMKEGAFKLDPNFIGRPESEKEKLWRERNMMDKIEPVIKDLKDYYGSTSIDALREINDFFAIMGVVGLDTLKSTTYQEFIDKNPDLLEKSSLQKDFDFLRMNYHVEDIIHIPSVTLVNTCYGVIHGIDKFYEEDFVPHFEPIWINKSDPSKGFNAFVYPYKTEGIIFRLNKEKICRWLFDCKIIESIPRGDALNDFFIKLDKESYKAVKILLHTFSHLLMRNSSVYTGLDLQSYGEKIFPGSAAIFIYSTSSINIGGLQFIFEHEVFNWFENIKFDIKECTLDPRCLDEKGACFSCLYVPEFVCCNFNQLLDRDVLLGKFRFKKGFWM